MVKTITDDFNYSLNIGNTYFGSMCLLKLLMLKHKNSIYFMHDILVRLQNSVTHITVYSCLMVHFKLRKFYMQLITYKI